MDREQGLAAVRSLVAESLVLDLDAVVPSSRLVPDLGADSLDFLDILFRLEEQFGIQLRENELSFLARFNVSDPDVVIDGRLTANAIARLRPWLPAIDEQGEPPTPRTAFELITVETLWRVVERQLGSETGGGR